MGWDIYVDDAVAELDEAADVGEAMGMEEVERVFTICCR